jgi:hypothetical protein
MMSLQLFFVRLARGCLLSQGRHVAAGDFDADFVGNFHSQGGVIHSRYAAVDAAACHDAIAFFKIGDHLSVLFGPFLLGSDQQKIKNDKHQNQGDEPRETTGAFSSGAACAQCICYVKQNESSFGAILFYAIDGLVTIDLSRFVLKWR